MSNRIHNDKLKRENKNYLGVNKQELFFQRKKKEKVVQSSAIPYVKSILECNSVLCPIPPPPPNYLAVGIH